MSNPFLYFWRHPRRTGFILFNVAVLAALVAWGSFTNSIGHDGLAGVPNLMLGYTGMGFLIVAWIAAWVAWGFMVASRQARRRS